MLAALVLASGLFTTLFLGARTETRLRESPGSDGRPTLGVDLETLPYLHFGTRSSHVDFKLDYAADLVQPDIENGFPTGPQLFQLANMSVWYAWRDWVLGAAQGGGFGSMNFSYLSPYAVNNGYSLGPPPVQLVPCTDLSRCAYEVVNIGSSASSVAVRYKHDRSSLALAPSYTVSGGLDTASRALMPVVSMPRVDLAFEQTVDRRNVATTLASATAADSTPRACNPATGGPPLDLTTPTPPLCAPRAQWASLREVWQHNITRRLTLALTAGATVARTDIDPSQPYGFLAYPVAGVQASLALQKQDADRPALHPTITDPPRPAVYAYAHVEPIIDPHWGIVDPRLSLGTALYEPLDSNNTLFARAVFLRSLPPTALDATYFTGEVELRHRLDRYRFETGGGVRGAYQDDPFTGRFYVVTAYLSFIWHEPRIVF